MKLRTLIYIGERIKSLKVKDVVFVADKSLLISEINNVLLGT